MPHIIINKDALPMPVMDISTPELMRQHLRRPVEALYNAEQLESIHRAIRYTQLYKQDEARAKMDEESPLTVPMPQLTKNEIKNLGKV